MDLIAKRVCTGKSETVLKVVDRTLDSGSSFICGIFLHRLLAVL